MSQKSYQAYGFQVGNDAYAVLDLNILRVVTAIFFLFFISSNFITEFVNPFTSGIIHLLVFILILKSSAKNFMYYNGKNKILLLFKFNGWLPIKEEYLLSDLDRFAINDNSEDKYKAIIALSNGKFIDPVGNYTDKKALGSLKYTYGIFAEVMKLKLSHLTMKSNNKKTTITNQQDDTPPSTNTTEQASSINLRNSNNAIAYLKRESEQPTVLRSKNSFNITIFILIIISLILIFLLW